MIPKKADVVVIGAGIVGCTLAHRLAEGGVRDVVVLDQGPLENTGGSSFHAPGLVFQTSPSRLMCLLAQRSVDYYDGLDEPERRTWLGVGSLEVAVEQQRVRELHRRRNHAEAYGLRGEVVDARPRRRPAAGAGQGGHPRRLPRGQRRPVQGGHGLPRRARARRGAGRALLRPDARDRRRQRAAGACAPWRPPAGSIATSTVVVCGGLWGPELQAPGGPADPDAADAAPVRVDEPAAVPARRRRGGDPPDPAPPGPRPVLPAARRRIRHRLLRPRLAAHRRAGARARVARPPGRAGRRSRRTTSRARWQSSQALVPAVHEAGIAESFNGHFAFTIDGNPLLGPSSFVDGLWLAEALWVTHAAGGARAVADVLLGPRPRPGARRGAPRPLPAAPRGAGLRAGARRAAVRRGIRRPAPGAAAAAPARAAHGALPPALRGARRAADGERRLGARAVVREQRRAARAGRTARRATTGRRMFWSEIVEREHHATRTAAGLFDLTPFTKVEVEGAGRRRLARTACARPRWTARSAASSTRRCSTTAAASSAT